MVDLQFGQTAALRVNAGFGTATVRLAPGVGVHRLLIDVTVTAFKLAEHLPVQISGDLYAELTNGPRWLGSLHVKHFVTRDLDNCPEQLTCSLSDGQLRAIEDLRGGDDLRLRLHLVAVLLHSVDGLHPVGANQEQATVPSEVWARQLKSLGAATVIEVLVPFPHDGSELRQAVTRIRDAKGHITDGRYGEAIRTARLALDYIRDVQKTDAPSDTKARDRNQAQRWDALINDLYSLANGASHDDVATRDFEWSRADAVMIVASVSALLGRLPA